MVDISKMKHRFTDNNPHIKISKYNNYKISHEVTWLLKNYISNKSNTSDPQLQNYIPPSFSDIDHKIYSITENNSFSFIIKNIIKIIIIIVVYISVVYLINM